MYQVKMEKYKYLFLIFLICSCHHITEADCALIEKGYLYPYPKECTQVLDAFAQYASNFTLCSIQNARPIRLCERCVEHYVNFHEKYQELSTIIVNGTSCRSLFISRDRLDAILEYHDSILSVWNKGHCYSCYDWLPSGPVLSKNTRQFKKMFNQTMECIVNNFNMNSSDICEKCMESYVNLDEFYKSLSSDKIGVDSVCMDIVDSMNATRSVWSKTLNCCKLRKTPEIVFLCCTGMICFLPALFYLAVRFCGPIRDLPNVLKQSRFKQTFLRSNTQRSR